MQNKRIVLLSIALSFSLSGNLSAIEVLESGYKVDVVAAYDDPGMGTAYTMVVGDNGNLYISHGPAKVIYKVTPSGQASVFASGFVARGMDWGGGTVYGNFLYVVDGLSGYIRKIAPNGTVSNFASSYSFDVLAIDKTSNYGGLLYTTNSSQDHTYRITQSASVSTFSDFPGWKDGGGAFDIAFDSTGNYGNLMYLTLRFTNDAGYQYASGLFSLNASGISNRFIPELFYPRKIDFDNTGNFNSKMYVLPATLSEPAFSIWKVQPDASHSVFAQTEYSIWDFTFSPDGTMFVVEYHQDINKIVISKISKVLTPTPVSYHVDGSAGNNTNNGLSYQTAFKTIQFAIDKAIDGDTVLVWPGTYSESETNGINFKGKAVTVKSAADAAVLQVPDYTAVTFALGETSGSVLSNFVINASNTAVLALFANPTLTNLTIVNNSNGIIADNASPDISNCIFWNNINGDLYGCSAKYSYLQDQVDGLVAHWKLDGDASDSAGSSNGTVSGAISTSGQINDALYFDGSNDRIVIDDREELENFSQVSISAWVYYQGYASGTNYDFIAGKEYVYKIDISSNHIRFLTANNWEDGMLISNQTITLNSWHHIIATYDGVIKKIYIDGILDKNVAYCSGSVGANSHLFTIAAQHNTNGTYEDYFMGKIDDVRVYNRPLSASEIDAMYEAGLAGLNYVPDPGFVDPNSDFHLLSQRGRYWPQIDKFVLDDVTSSCIDAGDPNIDPNSEPMPNGGRINIGAYGQSPFASMSYPKLTGDLNADHYINYKDLAILADQWLQKE